MNKTLRITLLVVLLLPLGSYAADAAKSSSKPARCLETHIVKHPTKTRGSIGEEDIKLTLQLEIAKTPEARARGLMKRDNIGECDGMAFWFPTESGSRLVGQFSPQKFWMKDTRIPLDIIFVGADQRIVYIAYGEPMSETHIGPDVPVSSVVEIAAGRAAREGITIGDSVFYEVAMAPHEMAR